MTSARSILLTLILSLGVIAPSAAGCDERQDLAKRILWKSDQDGKALFVPEAAIAEYATLAELPLEAEQIQSLSIARDKFLNPERYYPPHAIRLSLTDCRESSYGGTIQGSSPDAENLPNLLKKVGVAFVGRVVAVVPGFDFRASRIAQAVYLRPLEVLSAPESFKASNLLVYTRSGGRLRIHGVELCQEEVEGFHSPSVGDELLALAFLSPLEQGIVNVAWIFPIKEGHIIPQPYTTLVSEQEPIELLNLRYELKGDFH